MPNRKYLTIEDKVFDPGVYLDEDIEELLRTDAYMLRMVQVILDNGYEYWIPAGAITCCKAKCKLVNEDCDKCFKEIRDREKMIIHDWYKDYQKAQIDRLAAALGEQAKVAKDDSLSLEEKLEKLKEIFRQAHKLTPKIKKYNHTKDVVWGKWIRSCRFEGYSVEKTGWIKCTDAICERTKCSCKKCLEEYKEGVEKDFAKDLAVREGVRGETRNR